MTQERFAALADSYGGNLERWPADARQAARVLLGTSPEARAALSRAADLDARLARWTVPGPGAALSGSILQAASQAATLRHAATRKLRHWLAGLGAGAALAGGVAAGVAFATLALPPADPPLGSIYQLNVLGEPLDPADQPAEPPSGQPGGQPGGPPAGQSAGLEALP